MSDDMARAPRIYQAAAHEMGFPSQAEVDTFNALVAVWQRHLEGNLRNEAYYRQEVNPRFENDSTPEAVSKARFVMGWPTKAVDMLVARSVFTGFTADEGTDALNGMARDNGLGEVYRQAATSQLVSSCSFLTVGAGGPGEPDVVFGAHPATYASALWDMRARRIGAGMTVVEVDPSFDGIPSVPSWVNMYTADATYVCRRSGRNWSCHRAPNALGRPLMVPLRYRPDLSRPFGRPRISPAVRSLTDRALSVCYNTDVSAYFYTWPQRYLAGVDRKTVEQMKRSKDEMRVDKMLLVSTNANGDIPHYGQMPQMSMQPYNDQLQTLAKLFSGETSIPMNSLGIAFDNPSSAEAIYAAQNDLICEAEWLNGANGRSLEELARMALAHVEGTTVEGLPDSMRNVRARFENPQRPSMAARSDYAMKLASVTPEYAETADYWRDVGKPEEDIPDLLRRLQRIRTHNVLAAAALPAPVSAPEEG